MKLRLAVWAFLPAAILLAMILLMPSAIWAQANVNVNVMISEVLAENHTSITDEDLDTSDYIELYNAGPGPADLTGWYLTDDPARLNKWQFPAVELAPSSFLVVFASEKKRAVAGRELHTNFKLTPNGEFVALVAADGATIVSQFEPAIPKQVPDTAFGLNMVAERGRVLSFAAPAKFLVPPDDSLGTSWTAADFDDAAWMDGQTGIGYDRNTTEYLTDWINTDVEELMYRVNASIYIRQTFMVDDPDRFDFFVLKLQYGDGFVAYLNGEEITRDNTPSRPAWNSRATSRRLSDDVLAVRDFPIEIPLKPGRNVLAIHAMNDQRSSRDFFMAPEVQGIVIGGFDPAAPLYFPKPSPGLPNDGGLPALAPEPEFSVPGGVYRQAQGVVLSTSDPNVTIRYTTDRTLPTLSSPVYTDPIEVTGGVVIKARSFAPDHVPSRVAMQSYAILAEDMHDFSSNLPIVVLHGMGRSANQSTYIGVTATVIETDFSGRASMTTPPLFHGYGGIKIRGSSSTQFPKKSFNFEIWDYRDEDTEAPMLGMEAESDWVLYAPYTDKTLMRNVLSYGWSNHIGQWAPKTRFCEVFLGTTNTPVRRANYQGVYVLMEKIKRGDDRVDIRRMFSSQTEAPEVTGGYILKIDRLDPGDAGFRTARGTQLAYVYPKERETTPAQRAYIRNYLTGFESALYSASFRDPENGYAKWADVDSFIDHHIMVELAKNIDGYRLSTFMYKDRDGKLTMGPIWDYNLSLGNANYLNGWIPTGWYMDEGGSQAQWWHRLFRDPDFVDRYRTRWQAFRAAAFDLNKMLGEIDAFAEYLEEAQIRNYQKWNILGRYVWPNQFIGQTYAQEIAFMKRWLTDRVAWMDSVFIELPTIHINGAPVANREVVVDPNGMELSFAETDGDTVFTIDGTDPRTETGQVSDSAMVYSEPLMITENGRVVARTRFGGSWSDAREVILVVNIPQVAISELMYLPNALTGSNESPDSFEFIEFHNYGDTPFDLSGYAVTRGVNFEFPTDSEFILEPGEHVVAVRELGAFNTRYGSRGVRVAGTYSGSLSNRGETVTFEGRFGEPLIEFRYSSSWHESTAGNGHSLVLVDPTAGSENLGVADAWRPSTSIGGSPGEPDLPGRQVPGDITQDGRLNISDGITYLSYLFRGTLATLPCDGGTASDGANLTLLDINGDKRTNAADAIYLLQYLFKRGPAPTLGATCQPIPGCPGVCDV